MKLAFSGEARYPEYLSGYGFYVKRCRISKPLEFSEYKNVVRLYCASLAERLCKDGIVDLPAGLGQLCAAEIMRRPQYRGDKFIGYGKKDWDKGHYDGSPKSFGIVYLPNRSRKASLRSYGFVANRKLFKRMKALYDQGYRPWTPIEFNDDMI
jgi:hypothetical protein